MVSRTRSHNCVIYDSDDSGIVEDCFVDDRSILELLKVTTCDRERRLLMGNQSPESRSKPLLLEFCEIWCCDFWCCDFYWCEFWCCDTL